jgi:hypothetical protein
MTLDNLPHFGIAFGCSLARVYYVDKQFFCISMDISSCVPFSTTKLKNMIDYLMDLFKDTSSEIDIKFNYPSNFSRRKKKKINQLTRITNGNKNILTQWLSLLL